MAAIRSAGLPLASSSRRVRSVAAMRTEATNLAELNKTDALGVPALVLADPSLAETNQRAQFRLIHHPATAQKYALPYHVHIHTYIVRFFLISIVDCCIYCILSLSGIDNSVKTGTIKLWPINTDYVDRIARKNMEDLFNFNMKLSPDDRELLERLSDVIGENKSTVVRMGLREQGKIYGLWPKVAQLATEETERVTA